MTSSYYHFLRSTNAVYKVSMHMITVSVTFLQLNTAFNAFKEGFVSRIREKFKKKDFQKSIFIFRILSVL